MTERTFEHNGVTARLILGDCRDLLPIEADALVTDPPYGIGKDGQKETTGGHGGRKAYEFRGWDNERPSAETFALLLHIGTVQVIWGGNYFADLLPPTGKWLVWDKEQRINQSDGELAWTNLNGAVRIYEKNRVVLMTDGAVHPTQKPVGLMAWCMTVTGIPTGATVLDPYAGSGSTLIACLRTKRHAVRIERDPDNYATAVERLEIECQQPMLL